MKSLVGTLVDRIRNDAPIPYTGRRSGSLASALAATPAGREAELQAMGSVGTLFAIVDAIADGTAQVEWALWRKAKSGKPEDRTPVTSHAALDLWNSPNDFYTQQDFVETFQQHMELTGEGWWVIARNPAMRSIPLELWPVRPDRIAPVPDPKTFISGYVYTSPDGERVPLELDEVIQLKRPNPADPYRGLGPVQAVLVDIDSTKYSALWNRNFFLNSAEPGGVIEVPNELGDEQFNQLRDRWREQHRGVAAAHRVAILEGGAKWVDRKFTQRDMQFAELRGVSREIIREAYRFPKPMLGTVEDVNRANADAGEVVFARWLIVSRLRRIKRALNFKLLPMFGRPAEGLEWDFTSPVPEDQELESKLVVANAEAAQLYVAAGFTGDSVREALSLPDSLVWNPSLVQQGFRPSGPPLNKATGWARTVAHLLEDEDDGTGGLEAAMRWEAIEVDDENTCQPCRDNNGHLYRNRADAYEDYPDGEGYIHCEGAAHGNPCRGHVVKRRKGDEDA
ncbi:phage portal protein [Streptosporangiaceae bacterium NEAU-GS5]|nr:phage portal protein [Streptosporangiaceae bacterium NEAU-GS5]